MSQCFTGTWTRPWYQYPTALSPEELSYNIIYTKQAGVAAVTINRPDKLNATERGVNEDVSPTTRSASSRVNRRRVVLCTGADLGEQEAIPVATAPITGVDEPFVDWHGRLL